MKSSSIIGIALLVVAASLAVYEPFLQRGADVPAPEPTSHKLTAVPNDLVPDRSTWDTEEPAHQAVPKRKHVDAHKKAAQKQKKKTAARPKPTHAPRKIAKTNDDDIPTPLPAPTFKSSGRSEPTQAPAAEMIHRVQPLPRIEPTAKPRPVVHRAAHPAHVQPKIYAPATPSPRDLARQRQLERRALIDAAIRAARGTVERTVPRVSILSADADDHDTYVSVIVVERRSTGTVIESFVYTPGASALGLSQRKVISQPNADPYVSR